MCSFYCYGVFMMKMEFAVNLNNNKVVDNLLIYLVLLQWCFHDEDGVCCES
jgi:hypothetical protein